MIRFLHTGDWQLGMTRHFLSEEAQARFSQDRLDAIRALGEVARREDCGFAVVCGDVFESNHVDRRTIARAAEALRAVPVPVYLLPGNHDPLDAASVYRTPGFLSAKPDHVTVLDTADPVEVRQGVEVVGAPWPSRRPARDLAAEALRDLPASGTLRVLVAHGGVDVLSPDKTSPALIEMEALEAALAGGRIHFAALGDRHSVTEVGSSGRVWYSGSPEATDFVEERPGHVLVVEVSADSAKVTPARVGRWRFVREVFPVDGDDDLAAVGAWLEGQADKERTILKLGFEGTLTLTQNARLESLLVGAEHVFAAVQRWERKTEVFVQPDDSDFEEIEVSGFAREALEVLRTRAGGDGESAEGARDALALLARLAGGGR